MDNLNEDILDIGKKIVNYFKKPQNKNDTQVEEQNAEEIVVSEIVMQLQTLLSMVHSAYRSYEISKTHEFDKLNEIQNTVRNIEDLLNDYANNKIPNARINKQIANSFLQNIKNKISILKKTTEDTSLVELERNILSIMKSFMNVIDDSNMPTHNVEDEREMSNILWPYFQMNPTKNFSTLITVYEKLKNKIKTHGPIVYKQEILKYRTEQAKEIDKKFILDFEKDFKEELNKITDVSERDDWIAGKQNLMQKYLESNWKDLYERIWNKYLQKDWLKWQENENLKSRENLKNIKENDISQLRSQMKTIFER